MAFISETTSKEEEGSAILFYSFSRRVRPILIRAHAHSFSILIVLCSAKQSYNIQGINRIGMYLCSSMCIIFSNNMSEMASQLCSMLAAYSCVRSVQLVAMNNILRDSHMTTWQSQCYYYMYCISFFICTRELMTAFISFLLQCSWQHYVSSNYTYCG